MRSNAIQLVLADSSQVVMSGFQSLLLKEHGRIEVFFADSIATVGSLLSQHNIDLVLMNPMLVVNLDKQFLQLQSDYSSVRWIAILYGWMNDSVLSHFDARVQLDDSSETILSVVRNTLEEERDETTNRQPLSDRELDVLKLLVLGLSNKEIADKLFISTYTVISHRKNITQKTGIKSVSGLTIYAVVKGIVNLPSVLE